MVLVPHTHTHTHTHIHTHDHPEALRSGPYYRVAKMYRMP